VEHEGYEQDARVRPARVSDRDALAAMRGSLWPDVSPEEHRRELDALLAGESPGALPLVILVALDARGAPSGFLEVGLRSHADGCDPARPVGYVEGWFVREPTRHRGVGRALMRAAEEWARAHGCREMASDSLIANAAAQRAHEALGFEVVDRCVHYRKAL
jgi:aminoglycoside 6'-N-acetyltransferase I